MNVYEYICRVIVQEKSVGLLEAPQSNSLSLRRLQTVEVKSSESTRTVSECIDIDLGGQ